MVRGEKRSDGSERRKRPILVLLFSLLPLLIGVGIMAPGMVKVLAVEAQDTGPLSVRISRRLSRYAHQPLLLPRDFSAGFIPELLDLEHLFSRVDYISDPDAYDRQRLPHFALDFGNVIVLEDVDQRIREIVFKDPVLMNTAQNAAMPPPAADLTPLGGPGPIGPGPRFDDYLGPYVNVDENMVVPEPSTGLLLGLGLVLLGALRRRAID
jgi:hypothetical protein